MQELKLVSRFEANLLRVLHFLLRRDPTGQALTIIYEEMDAPPSLSRTCVELVQDTLIKGCVSILARASGWWKERHLQNGKVVEGRLWERHTTDELTLSFSENTLRFLLWLTAEDPKVKKPSWPRLDLKALTVADQFFFYLAFGELRGTESEKFFSGKELFQTNALCRLAYPENFTNAPENRILDYTSWLGGTGAAILEALQHELSHHWLKLEKHKAQIMDWTDMQALGHSQQHTLTAFLDALEQAGRWDLARFLFPTLQALLPENPKLEWWTEGLTSAGPRLMDRTKTNGAALVLPLLMSRLQEWDRQARSVGYLDENYPASQLWKSDWEHWQGNILAERAQALRQQMEPLAH